VEQSNALQKRTVAADPSSPFGSAKPHVPAETTRTDRQYLEEMMKAQVCSDSASTRWMLCGRLHSQLVLPRCTRM
jgi:hypothetical protein